MGPSARILLGSLLFFSISSFAEPNVDRIRQRLTDASNELTTVQDEHNYSMTVANAADHAMRTAEANPATTPADLTRLRQTAFDTRAQEQLLGRQWEIANRAYEGLSQQLDAAMREPPAGATPAPGATTGPTGSTPPAQDRTAQTPPETGSSPPPNPDGADQPPRIVQAPQPAPSQPPPTASGNPTPPSDGRAAVPPPGSVTNPDAVPNEGGGPGNFGLNGFIPSGVPFGPGKTAESTSAVEGGTTPMLIRHRTDEDGPNRRDDADKTDFSTASYQSVDFTPFTSKGDWGEAARLLSSLEKGADLSSAETQTALRNLLSESDGTIPAELRTRTLQLLSSTKSKAQDDGDEEARALASREKASPLELKRMAVQASALESLLSGRKTGPAKIRTEVVAARVDIGKPKKKGLFNKFLKLLLAKLSGSSSKNSERVLADRKAKGKSKTSSKFKLPAIVAGFYSGGDETSFDFDDLSFTPVETAIVSLMVGMTMGGLLIFLWARRKKRKAEPAGK